MTYWIGSYEAITAAEALAAAEVSGRPEYRDGVELPPEQWVTKRWAEPQQTADDAVWAIPAYPGITPENVQTVEAVEWPENEEDDNAV